jgi:hypothetical protein
VPAELADAFGVGPPAAAGVQGRAHPQDVAAVERARLLDPRDLESERANRLLGARDLGAPLDRPRSRQHGQIAAHDHRVLDEGRVGQCVGVRDLADLPARVHDRPDVGGVLRRGQGGVDGRAIAVGDDSLRHPAAGGPDQGDAVVHARHATRLTPR